MSFTAGIIFFLLLAVPILGYIIRSVKKWNKLAKQYPGKSQMSGIQFKNVSLLIDGSPPPMYRGNNSIQAAYNEEGIYIQQPGGILAQICMPIFIPFNQLMEDQGYSTLHPERRKLLIGHPVISTLTLGKAVYDDLELHVKLQASSYASTTKQGNQ
jgi:hypothetical protein